MTTENNLDLAKNERFIVAHEASIHLYQATKEILEKGLTNDNVVALANALAYNIVASNLLYINNDVNVDAMMPLVENAQIALGKLLKHQPKVEVQTELPVEEKKDVQSELDLTK